MADVFGSGNKADKWTQKATEWINYLYDHKSDTLVAGQNVTLTPDTTNHTVTISASGGGGGGTLTDVQVNGTSVVSGTVANIVISDVALTGSYTDLSNLPTIPTLLSQLTDDSTHRLVTDTQISTWNSAEQNVQSDWNQTNTEADDYIKNKPTLGTASAKDYTSSVTQNSTDLVTGGAVWSAIDNLPEPMVFKGTLGTGGTITTLPTASASNEGDTYKVITAGTYASQAAKVGDVFVSNGSEWVLIPAGDTDSDTWRAINVNGTQAIGSAISTGAVNFKNGNNVTISASGNDITISATDTTYSDATQSTHGLMSTSDKIKLDGIAVGAEVNVQSDWSQSDSTADDYIKNKPTIPTVNDGTLTITQNGTSKGTFTANQSSNATIALTDTTGYINQNENVLATDKVPYVMRKAKNIANATPYVRETLVGGTIGWNQLLQNGNFESATGWSGRYATVSVGSNVATLTPSSAGTLRGLTADVGYGINVYANHRYLMYCYIKPPINATASCNFEAVSYPIGITANTWNFVGNIVTVTENLTRRFYCLINENLTTSQSVLYKNANIIDLTVLLGTTIADYVYSMETATSGAGIAKLREWGFFAKGYYPYNAGNVLSVQTVGHKVIGFNQWDEEWDNGQISTTTGEDQTSTNVRSKNYIPILPNTTYYYNLTTNNATFFYDASKNFLGWASYNHSTFTTPKNAYYMRFYMAGAYGTIYKNDICFNISDSAKNGIYEPYKTNTYNVDDVILRGVPKLDTNNNLYYDGDTYSSDGHVIVKYGYVNLGSLTWTYDSSLEQFYAYMPSNAIAVKTNGGQGICAKYTVINAASLTADKSLTYSNSNYGNAKTVWLKDSAYTDGSVLQTALNDVILVFENASPSDTTWHLFENPQYIYPGGTEEYIDTREIPVPVGHITEYMGASDGKFYMPSSPLDDEKYMMTYKNGSIMWTRGNAWISLLDGHYDAYAEGQNIALPPNWTRLKISLECHSLDLGDSSKMIENEISRPTYEDGHYMSRGPCSMTFGMYNDLTCSITLSESTFEGITTYYVKMNGATLGQTATTDYHFWIYYQT